MITAHQWKVDVFVVWYDVWYASYQTHLSHLPRLLFTSAQSSTLCSTGGAHHLARHVTRSSLVAGRHTREPLIRYSLGDVTHAHHATDLLYITYIHVCIHSCPKNPVIRSMNSKQVYMHTCIFILLKGARPRGHLIAWNKKLIYLWGEFCKQCRD